MVSYKALNTLTKIADLLGIDPRDLLTGKE